MVMVKEIVGNQTGLHDAMAEKQGRCRSPDAAKRGISFKRSNASGKEPFFCHADRKNLAVLQVESSDSEA